MIQRARKASNEHYLVRAAGIEPAQPRPRDFKSLASTSFATPALSVFSTLRSSVLEGPNNGIFGVGFMWVGLPAVWGGLWIQWIVDMPRSRRAPAMRWGRAFADGGRRVHGNRDREDVRATRAALLSIKSRFLAWRAWGVVLVARSAGSMVANSAGGQFALVRCFNEGLLSDRCRRHGGIGAVRKCERWHGGNDNLLR